MLNTLRLGVIVTDRRQLPPRNRNDKPQLQLTVAGVGFSTRLYLAANHAHAKHAAIGALVKVEGMLAPEGRIQLQSILPAGDQDQLLNEVRLEVVITDRRVFDERNPGEGDDVSLTLAGLGFTNRVFMKKARADAEALKVGSFIRFEGRLAEEGRLEPDRITAMQEVSPTIKSVVDAIVAQSEKMKTNGEAVSDDRYAKLKETTAAA